MFSWRKRFGVEPLVGGNAPSQLVAVTVLDTPPVSAPGASAVPGVIVFSLSDTQLRLEGQVDAPTLTLLLARLLP